MYFMMMVCAGTQRVVVVVEEKLGRREVEIGDRDENGSQAPMLETSELTNNRQNVDQIELLSNARTVLWRGVHLVGTFLLCKRLYQVHATETENYKEGFPFKHSIYVGCSFPLT